MLSELCAESDKNYEEFLDSVHVENIKERIKYDKFSIILSSASTLIKILDKIESVIINLYTNGNV